MTSMGGTGRAVLAVGTVLVAVGCGGSGGTPGAVRSPTPGPGGAQPAPRTSGPGGEATPRVSDNPSYGGRTRDPEARMPTHPPRTGWLPAAADGTNLRACRDGRCEVQVSPHDKLPAPSGMGIDTITVTAVTADGITLTGTGPGTVVSVAWGGPGETSYLNDLAITLVAVADGKAVLRLKRRSR